MQYSAKHFYAVESPQCNCQHPAGMSAALDSKIEEAIDAMCNPMASDEGAEDMHDAGTLANVPKMGESEIQPAPPRVCRESKASIGWESDADYDFGDDSAALQRQPRVWHQTLLRLLQQIAVAGIVITLLWAQGRLPSRAS